MLIIIDEYLMMTIIDDYLMMIIIDDYYWWLFDDDYLMMIIKKDCNKTNCSSGIYKVIRPVLNFLSFFYDKISQALKSTQKHSKELKSTKRH